MLSSLYGTTEDWFIVNRVQIMTTVAAPVQLLGLDHVISLYCGWIGKGLRNSLLLTNSFKLLSTYKSIALLKSIREGRT